MFNYFIACPSMPLFFVHFLTFKNALRAAVASARRRIFISAYVINANLKKHQDPVTQILFLLRDAQARGLDVKIILDNPPINRPNFHCNKMLLNYFKRWQIPHACPPSSFTAHAKIVIVDSSFCFIGSHNLARSSLNNPLDCTVEIRNHAMVDLLADSFLSCFQDGRMDRFFPPFDQSQLPKFLWMEPLHGTR